MPEKSEPTNRYKYLMATGGVVPGTTDIRMGLLKTCAGVTQVADINTIADMEAHADFAEMTAVGYARIATAGGTVTEDDTNNWALIDFNDVAFPAIATGETVNGYFIFVQTGNDATAPVLQIGTLPATPTNGGTITVTTASGVTQVT